MTKTTLSRLEKAIRDYLGWIESLKLKHTTTGINYEEVLSDFVLFVRDKQIAWDDLFTLDTWKEFRKYCSLPNASHAIRGLSGYHFRQARIPQPLRMPNYQIDLPDIYEEYLIYYEQIKQLPYRQVKCARRVLASFHDYLERSEIGLSALRIEHLDAFLAAFNERFTPGTCRSYRSYLRGFLSYLYHERRILQRDLAPLLVGRRSYAQAKPPSFLRPQQVQKLFASLKLSCPMDIRTYAMVHLAYSLGLRPVEISTISLDDISFTKVELVLRDRKSNNPIRLPIPERTIKAIAAYIIGVRPKSKHRTLFLSFHAPYGPLSPEVVAQRITFAMKQAGLSSSAYWLRHTYAQNLLEGGVSIFEIKEMLGHDKIESTKIYLHIDTRLMREVLFDEDL